MIRVIPTIFMGTQFKSRLEAKWAVVFEHLGFEWEYEKEGYVLDDDWYLPDFYLPGYEVWIEIKGKKPTWEEQKKCARLAEGTKKTCYIFFGSIPRQVNWGGDNEMVFFPIASLNTIPYKLGSNPNSIPFCILLGLDKVNKRFLEEAYNVARNYQFT